MVFCRGWKRGVVLSQPSPYSRQVVAGPTCCIERRSAAKTVLRAAAAPDGEARAARDAGVLVTTGFVVIVA